MLLGSADEQNLPQKERSRLGPIASEPRGWMVWIEERIARTLRNVCSSRDGTTKVSGSRAQSQKQPDEGALDVLPEHQEVSFTVIEECGRPEGVCCDDAVNFGVFPHFFRLPKLYSLFLQSGNGLLDILHDKSEEGEVRFFRPASLEDLRARILRGQSSATPKNLSSLPGPATLLYRPGSSCKN